MAGTGDLTRLLIAIANLDHEAAVDLLLAMPSLATARLARPACQRDVILYLIEAGADPNAAAAGGVTPPHRAVRNRCSAAVAALLRAGADPRLQNDRGSTASDLAHWATGRGGAGSATAKTEQAIIIELLESS